MEQEPLQSRSLWLLWKIVETTFWKVRDKNKGSLSELQSFAFQASKKTSTSELRPWNRDLESADMHQAMPRDALEYNPYRCQKG